MHKHLSWLLLSLLLCPLSLRADDWPQWRGPDRSGVSKETGLLKKWPEKGPKLSWVYNNAGLGFSSFAIVGGKLYTLGTRGDDEIVLALDAKSGKELWTAKIAPIFTFDMNEWGDGPRSTPTVDGNLLFALGGQGELVCVDISKNGEVVWRKNLIQHFGGAMMTVWGYSESPLVDGDLLICTPGGAEGTLAALDKKTGVLKWRSKGWTDKAPYSSPMKAEIDGVRQYIQLGYIDDIDGGVAAGVDAKTGKKLWSTSILKEMSYAISPTPIIKGNLVYVTSSSGCHLFEINKGKATEKYGKPAQKKVKNRDGGVILVGDHIYGHSETKRWICQEFATGTMAWDERDILSCASGSITSADGMLYLYTDEGEVGLAEATPKELKLAGSFTIPQKSAFPGKRPSSRSSRTWAHPVVANGVLYLRDAELIFAYEVKK